MKKKIYAGEKTSWHLYGQDKSIKEPHQLIEAKLDAQRVNREERFERWQAAAEHFGVDLLEHGRPLPFHVSEEVRSHEAAKIVRTVVTKTAKSRILPFSTPIGGSFTQRQKTREFNRWVLGMMEETGVYDIDARMQMLILVYGLCGLMPYYNPLTKRLDVDLLNPWQIDVDPVEASHGTPQEITVTHYVDRHILASIYEDDKQKLRSILDLRQDFADDILFAAGTYPTEMIRVRDTWRLASANGVADGRHCRSISNCTLEFEEYKRTNFPLIIGRCEPALHGFWPVSYMDRLIPLQREANELDRKIQEGHEVMGVTRLKIPRGANVKAKDISNIPGTHVEYDGPQEPQDWSAMPVHPQTYEWRNKISDRMAQEMGLSEMSLRGTVPSGVTAAKALQFFDDTESQGLSTYWRERERVYLEFPKICLQVLKDAVGSNYNVVHVEKGQGKRINLKDVDVGEDNYRFIIHPTNFLSTHPSAKFDRLDNMLERGVIDPTQYRRMGEIPDLDREDDLDNSSADVIDMVMEHIYTKLEPMSAEEFDDHNLIKSRGQKFYNMLRVRGPDDPDDPQSVSDHYEGLNLLSNYINSAALMTMPPPAAPMDPTAAAAQPMAEAGGPPMDAMGAPVEPSIGVPAQGEMPPGAPV